MISRESFLAQMREAMDIDYDLQSDMILANIDEWDSLSMLNVLAIFHDNSIDIEVEDLEKCINIEDILNKANI